MSTGSDRTLGEFLSEAQEILESFNRTLLDIERRGVGDPGTPARVNDAFRAVHSLKGLAGLVGLSHLARLSHTLESLLDALRLGKVDTGPVVMDALFDAVELLGKGLAAAAGGGDLAADVVDAYERRLGQVLEQPAARPHEGDPLAGAELDAAFREVLTEFEEHRLRENLRHGHRLFVVAERFELAQVDAELERLRAALGELGEVIAVVPAMDDDDFESLTMRLLVAAGLTTDEVAAALAPRPITLSEIAVGERPEPSPPPDRAAAPPAPAPVPLAPAPEPRVEPSSPDAEVGREEGAGAVLPEGTLRSVSQSVRVDIRRLDALMNAVGDLGLVHANLTRLIDRTAAAGLTAESRELLREIRLLERKIAELQEGILEVRMVPLRQIFDKLSRVVRKVARSIDKEVRLEIGGEDTELDKLMVEELSDPLLHVIRNALDHGIEAPAERRAAGKPEVGTIRVQALQQGNRVVITVEDDGRGIDPDAVARAALGRGLISAREAETLNRRELVNLLFLPGMSTRGEATELSGRGVGLDVVKTNVGNLSGILDLTSTAGRGTAVTITVPVTLAIIQALVVAAAGRTYAVPLNNVVETLRLEPGAVRRVEGREVIQVRQQTVRLARLDRVFRLGGAPRRGGPAFVVVVGVAQHRLGLVVDELVGQKDAVIKSLGRLLAPVPGIAGATELGGRQLVLVLDVPALVDECLRTGRAEVAA